MSSSEVLQLKDKSAFGAGGRRLCFTHPNDPSKCVKILRQDDERTVRLKKKRIIPASFHREYDNNRHEMEVLNELYDQIGEGMTDHLPRCYGMHETDLGPGLVLDLIRDEDGQIARSIRQLITDGFDLADLRTAYDKLGDFLHEHIVLSRKLLDHNIVVSFDKDGVPTMYIIDGLGDPAFIPLARWSKTLGRAKVKRRVEEAWPRFENFAKQGGVTQEMRKNSTWDQGILRHRD
ncbi:YrbL family protein [uncultured Cocleimonas sp.]|uniref:YrbL family protein n=1 Tax=uncultured Cocleimonas sp. TaxID=1051587 RepID=UPI0026357BDC|nr:YrbL family protein [uncultured Cocleimonas sp.]